MNGRRERKFESINLTCYTSPLSAMHRATDPTQSLDPQECPQPYLISSHLLLVILQLFRLFLNYKHLQLDMALLVYLGIADRKAGKAAGMLQVRSLHSWAGWSLFPSSRFRRASSLDQGRLFVACEVLKTGRARCYQGIELRDSRFV